MKLKMIDLKHFVKSSKKIIGAGINYNSLVKERNIPVPKEPIVFMKPSSSYIVENQKIKIPKGFDVFHEVELGVIIGKNCRNINSTQAKDYIGGYCMALDLTAVNILGKCRENGWPWLMGKGFDTACPVSNAMVKEQISDPDNIRIWCSVNDVVKQDCSTCDMVFGVGELIAYISSFMTLEPYDLVLTGSPKGVGPIARGDVIKGGYGDTTNLQFSVE